jgi:hypothetical protein
VKSKYYSDRVKKEYAYDVFVTEVETVDNDINGDANVKKNQSSYDSGLIFYSHNCSNSDVTYDILSGRHDTIFER